MRFKWSFGHLDEETRGDERTRRVNGKLFFRKKFALNLNFHPLVQRVPHYEEAFALMIATSLYVVEYGGHGYILVYHI